MLNVSAQFFKKCILPKVWPRQQLLLSKDRWLYSTKEWRLKEMKGYLKKHDRLNRKPGCLKKKLKLGVLPALIVGGMLLSGCGQQAEETVSAEEAKTPVEIAEVSMGVLDQSTRLSGKVEGSFEVPVIPKVPGKVEQVAVAVGDAVSKGELLVALDQAAAEAQVDQAQAGLEAARAGLKQAESGASSQVSSARSAVAQAEGGVKQAEAAIDQTAAQMQTAQVAYESALKNAERMRQLHAAGAASQVELEQAEDALKNAEANLQPLQKAYESAQASLDTAKAALAAAQESYTIAQQKTSVDVARAQVTQAEAGLKAARVQLENMQVSSPIDGKVAAVFVEPGEMAAQTTPVVTVVQDDPVHITVQLPEGLFNLIAEGQRAQVSVGEETLSGTIVSKDLTVDEKSRAYTAKIEVPNPDGKLVSGMTASVSIANEDAKQALLIPATALVSGSEGREGTVFVYHADEETVEKRTVTVGQVTSSQVEIVDGLEEGEQVVIKGQFLLEDGDAVQLAEAEPGESTPSEE